MYDLLSSLEQKIYFTKCFNGILIIIIIFLIA